MSLGYGHVWQFCHVALLDGRHLRQSWRVAPVDGYWSPALLILPMRSRVLAYLPHCRYGLASEQ
jgi:hypothetical protein